MRTIWRVLRADQRGLTLVELMIALVMLGVIFGGMFASTSAMAHSWAVGQHRVGVQQMGRASLDWMIRRIRLAGQGYERGSPSCLPFYRVAKPSYFKFWADIVASQGGPCGFEAVEYRVCNGQLIERISIATPSDSDQNSDEECSTGRPLTVTEEVGIITVTDLNFCYYDVFDQLLPGQTLSLAGGQETCSGEVNSRLGDIYRVKVRLRVISGRPGEMPFDVASQAVRRLEVLP